MYIAPHTGQLQNACSPLKSHLGATTELYLLQNRYYIYCQVKRNTCLPKEYSFESMHHNIRIGNSHLMKLITVIVVWGEVIKAMLESMKSKYPGLFFCFYRDVLINIHELFRREECRV